MEMHTSICVNIQDTYGFIGLRERCKRERSEEEIDCHHQDSNQGRSLEADAALTTELWCSCHGFFSHLEQSLFALVQTLMHCCVVV